MALKVAHLEMRLPGSMLYRIKVMWADGNKTEVVGHLEVRPAGIKWVPKFVPKQGKRTGRKANALIPWDRLEHLATQEKRAEINRT
jgi:hypothetical protein